MTNELYIVAMGGTRIQLTDKKSALHLVSTLAVLECTEPITSSKISGCKDYPQIFEVCFFDKAITVAGQHDAETVQNWMLTLGCNKVSIERLVNNDNLSEKTSA